MQYVGSVIDGTTGSATPSGELAAEGSKAGSRKVQVRQFR